MALMPGAVIRLIPRHNTGAKRPKGRGTSFHVTASGAASMFAYFSTVADCSHFHVAKDGTIEQYIDTDFYGAAQVDGNDMVSVETQGAAPGVNAETEPWTPQQVTSNARIARWVHDTEGAPLVLMPDSRPGSRGVASHRLGIAPWRVAGGQVWSRVNGKVCPGSAKIAQLPQIIALAAGGATISPEDDMTPDQDARLKLAVQLAQQAKDLTQSIVDGLYRGGPATGGTPLADQIQALGKPPVSGAVNVGGASVDLDELAEKVADKLAARLAS